MKWIAEDQLACNMDFVDRMRNLIVVFSCTFWLKALPTLLGVAGQFVSTQLGCLIQCLQP